MGKFPWHLWMIVVSHALRSDIDETVWTLGENGKLYFVNKSPMAWSDASRECREKNSKLITLDSKASENVFKQIIKNQKHGLYWSGLSEDLFHKWSWESGIGTLDYSNWGTGQPYQESESPGCVSVNSIGKWHVSDCEVERMSICERPDDGTSYTKESFPKSIYFITKNGTNETKIETFKRFNNHQNKLHNKDTTKEKEMNNLSTKCEDSSLYCSAAMISKLKKLRSYLNDTNSDYNRELNSDSTDTAGKLELRTTMQNEKRPKDRSTSTKAYTRHFIKTKGKLQQSGLTKKGVLMASTRNIINDVAIVTTGGNGHNKTCVFPFVMYGKTVFKCIKTPEKLDKKWCSVTSNYDRDLQWGYCVFDNILKLKSNSPYEQPLLEKAKQILDEKKFDNTMLVSPTQNSHKYEINNKTKKLFVTPLMKKQTEELADKLVSVIFEKINENPPHKASRENKALDFKAQNTNVNGKISPKVIKNSSNKVSENKAKEIFIPKKKDKKIENTKKHEQQIKNEENKKLKIQTSKFTNSVKQPLTLKDKNVAKHPLNNTLSNKKEVFSPTIKYSKFMKTNSKDVFDRTKTKITISKNQSQSNAIHKKEQTLHSIEKMQNQTSKEKTSGEFNKLVNHILNRIKDVSKSDESTDVFGQAHDLYDLINQPTYNQSVQLTHNNKDLTNKDMKTLEQIENDILNGVKNKNSSINQNIEPEFLKWNSKQIVHDDNVKDDRETRFSKIDLEDYGVLNLIEEKGNDSSNFSSNVSSSKNENNGLIYGKNVSEQNKNDSKDIRESSVFANHIEEAKHNSHGQMLIGDTEQETSTKEDVSKKLLFEDSLVTFTQKNHTSMNLTYEPAKQLQSTKKERKWISTLEVMTKDGKIKKIKDIDLKIENQPDKEDPSNLNYLNPNDKDFEYYDSTEIPLQNTINDLKSVGDDDELSKNGNYLIKVIHEHEPDEKPSKWNGDEKEKTSVSLLHNSSKKLTTNVSVEGFNNEVNKFVERMDPTASFHKTQKTAEVKQENLFINKFKEKNFTIESEKLFSKPDLIDLNIYNKDSMKQLSFIKDIKTITSIKNILNNNSTTDSLELMSEGKVEAFGGNSKENCVFPFVYEGASYWHCIKKSRSLPWCSTTSNYDAMPLWRFCCFKGDCKIENNIKKQAIENNSKKFSLKLNNGGTQNSNKKNKNF